MSACSVVAAPRAFVIPSTIKAHGGEEEKINIYPGLRLPEGHIYDVISSLMHALRHIMDGRTFHPACYDFANTTRNVLWLGLKGWVGGVRHCEPTYVFSRSRRRIPKWQQRNFYFGPADSNSGRAVFLFVVSHGSHESCIYYSLSVSALSPSHQMQSRRGCFRLLLFQHAYTLFFHFVAWQITRIKLFVEMRWNSQMLNLFKWHYLLSWNFTSIFRVWKITCCKLWRIIFLWIINQ